MRKIVTVFPDGGDVTALRHSIDTFLVMNASDLDRFTIIIHLRAPSEDAKSLVRSLYSHRDITIMTSKSSPCMPCIMKRHKVRYAIIIPPGNRSIAPLVSYLDEFAVVLQNYPTLTHIRLLPDTDHCNLITKRQLVYRYATSHVLVGNGNLRRDLPILIKSTLKQTTTSVSGMLKPQIFRRYDQ